MANHDPRIDAYIAKSAEFARPLLEHLRERVHAACPEVEEGLKWSMPFFSYKGAPMCMMASFKQHCSFGFWLSKEVTGGSNEDGMGQFGKLATLQDLPPDKQLATYLKKAMALNEAGVKKTRPKTIAKPAPILPDDLAALLAQKSTQVHARRTKVSDPAHSANTSTGSTRRRPMPRARSASPPRLSGWPKARSATGNTRTAEGRQPMIRTARDEDAAAIHAIYAPSVIDGVATFETELPGVNAMRERLRARLQHYPWLVWEEASEVLAYAYAGRFRERAAYDWIAETSIYVRTDAHRRGIARKLYGVLLEVMRLQGITQAVGVITLPGTPSVAMHEVMGFTPAGVWRQCGYKLGRWWDVGVWQKELQPAQIPPRAVTPFNALVEAPALRELLD